MKNSPARLRLVKFSLRGLLLLIAIVACFMSWIVIPARRQKAARRWVESQRGEYIYESPYRPGDSWYIRSSGASVPNCAIEWFGIDAFADVTVVQLQTEEIYTLQPLTGMSSLESLYINQFVHSQVDFSVLQSLPRLRKLELTEFAGVDRSLLEEISATLPGVEIVSAEFPDFALDPGRQR